MVVGGGHERCGRGDKVPFLGRGGPRLGVKDGVLSKRGFQLKPQHKSPIETKATDNFPTETRAAKPS